MGVGSQIAPGITDVIYLRKSVQSLRENVNTKTMKLNDLTYKIQGVIFTVHKKQLLSYLKLSYKKPGILVNFNIAKLIDKENLIRIIN